jgi:CheY-like chemotaxis protein
MKMHTTQPFTILIVDDDRDALEALSDLLRDEGYRIVQAHHGREALDALNNHPTPSLILLDLMMPVMNGFEFLSAKARDRAFASIPVIIISGIADNVPATVPLLRKPINPHDLMHAVKHFSGVSGLPN